MIERELSKLVPGDEFREDEMPFQQSVMSRLDILKREKLRLLGTIEFLGDAMLTWTSSIEAQEVGQNKEPSKLKTSDDYVNRALEAVEYLFDHTFHCLSLNKEFRHGIVRRGQERPDYTLSPTELAVMRAAEVRERRRFLIKGCRDG